MPFASIAHEYTKANVEAMRPNQIGCYGLFIGDLCVYIGRGDIRARLLGHLAGDNSRITRERPAHWMDVVTIDDLAEEKRLITSHLPTCNRRTG